MLGNENSLGMLVRKLRKHEHEDIKKTAGILYEEFLATVKAEKDFLDAQKREADDKARAKREKQKQAKQRKKTLENLAEQVSKAGERERQGREDRGKGREGRDEKASKEKKKRKRKSEDEDEEPKKKKRSKGKGEKDKKESKKVKKAKRNKKSVSSPEVSQDEDAEENQEEEQEPIDKNKKRTWSEEAVKKEVKRILTNDSSEEVMTKRKVRELLAEVFDPADVEANKAFINESIGEVNAKKAWNEGSVREALQRIYDRPTSEEMTKRKFRELLKEEFEEQDVDSNKDLVNKIIDEITSGDGDG